MEMSLIGFCRPSGRPNYKMIEYDLKRVIIDIPSISLLILSFFLIINQLCKLKD